MFSTNPSDITRPGPVSDMMGPGGIPKPKSLLSSFLFSRLSSQDGQQQEEDRPQQQRFNPPLSLRSNLLPQSLLGDTFHDMGTPRSRTVTGDAPTTDEASRNNFSVLPPRRPWGIASEVHKALPKVPSHYPPFDPNCTALVTDVPPSIVLVRISECLRRRSIAVEYDDESVTARCMTVDRVQFMIQLYRAQTSLSWNENETMEDTPMALPYDTIIVEIRKITGGSSSSMSFYAACSKILLAAKGLDTGDDERPSHRCNGTEFKPQSIAKRRHPSSVVSSRALKRRKPTLLYASTDSSAGDSGNRSDIAEQSLEAALELLQKDRLECQQLGMERLVNLTNRDSVGDEICRHVSRRLLLQEQLPDKSSVPGGIESSSKNWSLMNSIMHPGAKQALVPATDAESERRESDGNTPSMHETKNDRMIRSFLESPALTAVTPPSRKHSPDRQNSTTSSPSFVSSFRKKRSFKINLSADVDLRNQSNEQMSGEELRHEARLRSLALRIFCNALDCLSNTKELPEILHPSATDRRTSHKAQPNIRKPSRWVKPAFLLSLVQDLQGAGRPPSVSETSYKLASVHEAAMAARCLRLLAGYDGDESGSDDDAHQTQQHQQKDKHKHETVCREEQEAVREFLRSEAVLERLEYARTCGRAAHAILHYESELTHNKLTENDRSC